MSESPRTIGVCGVGQIGLALGLACWRSGLRVWIYARNAQKLEKAKLDLEKMDKWLAAEFPGDAPRYGEVNFTSDLGKLNQEADLVVEGIAEDMQSKVGSVSRAQRRCGARRNSLQQHVGTEHFGDGTTSRAFPRKLWARTFGIRRI